MKTRSTKKRTAPAIKLAAVTDDPIANMSTNVAVRARGLRRRTWLAAHELQIARRDLMRVVRDLGSMVSDHDAYRELVGSLVKIGDTLFSAEEHVECIAEPSPDYAEETEHWTPTPSEEVELIAGARDARALARQLDATAENRP
jgi:hypothetical protein